MIRVEGLKLPVAYDIQGVKAAVCKKLHIRKTEIKEVIILKEALDARKKPKLYRIVTAGIILFDNEAKVMKANLGTCTEEIPYTYEPPGCHYRGQYPPLVVGAGPAGLFGALILAEAGLKPTVIEAGKDSRERTGDILNFCGGGDFLSHSNIQFGEGGAGMFSDGKLTTGTKDPRHRKIIAELIAAGAPAEIGYLAKPHIGSDHLPQVSAALRRKIESLGGVFRFETALLDMITADGELKAAIIGDKEGRHTVNVDHLLLAAGHSARATAAMLLSHGVSMAQKPFSLGVRIEHLQREINIAQYGEVWEGLTADYKLSAHLSNSRTVYTFCMCPGGVVVPATSEQDAVVTNGMSEWTRHLTNANSALLVSVKPADFPDAAPLSGITLQRRIEAAAFRLGGDNYSAPAQRVEDFLFDRPTTAWGKVKPSYRPGVTMCNLNGLFPAFVTESLKAALPLLGQKLKGFDDGDAVLTAPETRSSAPYRILRDEGGESNLSGLYPAGEGSGYAGGIMSSAADGIKSAEKIMAG